MFSSTRQAFEQIFRNLAVFMISLFSQLVVFGLQHSDLAVHHAALIEPVFRFFPGPLLVLLCPLHLSTVVVDRRLRASYPVCRKELTAFRAKPDRRLGRYYCPAPLRVVSSFSGYGINIQNARRWNDQSRSAHLARNHSKSRQTNSLSLCDAETQ